MNELNGQGQACLLLRLLENSVVVVISVLTSARSGIPTEAVILVETPKLDSSMKLSSGTRTDKIPKNLTYELLSRSWRKNILLEIRS